MKKFSLIGGIVIMMVVLLLSGCPLTDLFGGGDEEIAKELIGTVWEVVSMTEWNDIDEDGVVDEGEYVTMTLPMDFVEMMIMMMEAAAQDDSLYDGMDFDGDGADESAEMDMMVVLNSDGTAVMYIHYSITDGGSDTMTLAATLTDAGYPTEDSVYYDPDDDSSYSVEGDVLTLVNGDTVDDIDEFTYEIDGDTLTLTSVDDPNEVMVLTAIDDSVLDDAIGDATYVAF